MVSETKYIDTWHPKTMRKREAQYLTVTQPPRHLKQDLISSFLVKPAP